ncbi:MAG: ketopantoate reductase family protein [Solirubrobacteraceae bacterium]
MQGRDRRRQRDRDRGGDLGRSADLRRRRDPAELVYSAAKSNYRHRPSMPQDVAAHRATEIATLNGGVVRAADGAGVDVPLHQAMVDLIRRVERSWG